jgi:hypothetical protein
VKSKEVKIGLSTTQESTNLTESSKEGYGSMKAVLPTTMTMTMTMMITMMIMM